MRYAFLLFNLLFFFVAGCGNSDPNSLANAVADPTGQLPAHVAWGSYNLYRFDPATPGQMGQWVKVVSLGQVTDTLPTLGLRPVLLTHGLGGSIASTKLAPLAQFLYDNQEATSVLGFEYDSQDGVNPNGAFLTQAMHLVAPVEGAPPTWAMIGHSMGGLVIRSALEYSSLPIPATGNKIVTLGSPHLGTSVVNALQATTSLVVQAAAITVLDQDGGFTNADGNPCQVDLNGPGFSDLRTDSPVLASLNADVANNHSEVQYYTIAGTSTGEFQAVDDLLGVSTDDGFVTILSANWSGLGAAAQDLAPVDHEQLTTDNVTVFPLVQSYLTP